MHYFNLLFANGWWQEEEMSTLHIASPKLEDSSCMGRPEKRRPYKRMPFGIAGGSSQFPSTAMNWLESLIKKDFPFSSSKSLSASATDCPCSSASLRPAAQTSPSCGFPSLICERHHRCRSARQQRSQRRGRHTLWPGSCLLLWRPTTRRSLF